MKRLITLLQCAVMIFIGGVFCTVQAEATETASFKTVSVNVAQNKQVTTSEDFLQEMAAYPLFAPDKMTDGRITSCLLGTFPQGSYVQVDLERKYLLKEIVLTDRYDADHAPMRTNLTVLASNDADFAECDIIDSVGTAPKFNHCEKWTITLPSNKYYRYIRIRKDVTAYGGIGELQVFAEQTVTQLPVSSAKASKETESLGYVYSASRAIDGKNANAGDAWVADGTELYHFLTLTLPEAKHIGMIELEDRFENGNTTTRQADLFYGSNALVSNEIAGSLATFDGLSEYTYLGSTGHYGNYPEGEPYPYPPYPGMYRACFSDEQAFSYFTMKKDYPLSAAVGEIRLFEVNPQIISAKTDVKAKTITLEFTDEMDFAAAAEAAFTVHDGNETISLSGTATDNYTYVLDASGLDKEKNYTLTVSKELKNKKNVGLCEHYVQKGISFRKYSCPEIKAYDPKNPETAINLYSASQIEVSAPVTNNTDENAEFLLIYTQYDKHNTLLTTTVCKKEIGAGLTDTVTINHSLSYSGGDYIKVFLWDASLAPVTDVQALTAPYTKVYVSPNGNDKNSGLEDSPVATIARAQEIVRSMNSFMEEDIRVFLADGVYPQEKTLTFTTRDSGKNGKRVRYIGSENTVISGGKKVTNFQKIDENGLYCADLDIDTVRELYINGKKAVRAQSEGKIKPLSVYEENGERAGFVVSGNDISLYQNPHDIQLHYQRSWRSLVLNVSSIEQSGENYILKMEQPAFSYASAPLGAGYAFWVDETNRFYLENALELLDSENEFYYDKGAKKLYYRTLKTDMDTAVVYVPVLEQLLTVKADHLNNKVKNISFENLTFTHCTYRMPENGYLGDQAQRFEALDTPETAYPLDTRIVGAAVRVHGADNVDFSNSRFYGMGAVALGLYDGSENCDITGNVFYDINDSAITVGLPSDAYMQVDLGRGNEVALYKPVKASANVKHYPGCYGNDGDAATGWTMSAGEDGLYTNEYWQVDLGKAYTIDSIVMKARKDYDQQNTRRNFEILGSNDENFSEGSYSILANRGSEPFSIADGYLAQVSDNGKYRYIRVRKTVNEYFYLADIEVYTKDEGFIPVKEVCKNNHIRNNYITDIGCYNSGAPGIQTYYTEGVEISHNTIKNVPYSGIALGWGWTQTTDSVTSKNNIVSQNLIDTYNMVNFDGGGIYTLGQQPGSEIFGNYIKNQINAHAAFYPDSGSAEYSFTGNVIEDADIPFFLYGPQSNLTVTENYANSTNTAYHKGTNCTVEAPQFFVPGKESDVVLAIKGSAGLEEEYKGLLSKVYEKEIRTTDIVYNYGNAIDENRWNIGTLQDPRLLELYLEYQIAYAKALYNTADFITQWLNKNYQNLNTAIKAAESTYNTLKKQITYATYDSETGIYAENEGKTMNRTAVIEARLALKEAIRVFLES